MTIITSTVTPLSLAVRSASFFVPSGLITDLSKSKSASDNKVTFVEVTARAGAAGAAFCAGAGAAALGAGAGAGGFRAPSQSAAAVAGVQLASLQQREESAPERNCVPPDCQLSFDLAC